MPFGFFFAVFLMRTFQGALLCGLFMRSYQRTLLYVLFAMLARSFRTAFTYVMRSLLFTIFLCSFMRLMKCERIYAIKSAHFYYHIKYQMRSIYAFNWKAFERTIELFQIFNLHELSKSTS